MMRNVYCVFFEEGVNLLLSSIYSTEKEAEKERDRLKQLQPNSEFVVQSWLVNKKEED